MWKWNNLSIKGLQGTSLIDFPGVISAVVFTGGCDLRCAYCQNPALQTQNALPDLPPEQVYLELRYRIGFIDGVVVTGGEPTLHEGLPDFLVALRELNLKIKLDTNGMRPDTLQDVIDRNLVDYVAMDYKAPLDILKHSIPGADPEAFARSAKILLDGSVPYEFRTTVHPGLLTRDDILRIADEIDGARAYYLQPFRSPDGSHPQDQRFFDELESALAPRFPRFGVRGLHRRAPEKAGV